MAPHWTSCAAVADGRLALLPVEQALVEDGPRYTLAQVAERSGLEPAFVTALMRALALPLPADEGEPAFTDADVDAARTVAGFRQAGIDDDALLESSRVVGTRSRRSSQPAARCSEARSSRRATTSTTSRDAGAQRHVI